MSFLPSLAYALLMGAIPLVEVIREGRSPGVLLLLFWFETVLLIVTGTIRIVAHRRATSKAGHYASQAVISDPDAGAESTRRRLADGNAFLRSFLGINGIFTAAHGVFVLPIVFLFPFAGPVSWSDAGIALAWAAGVQALFFFIDLPRIPGWTFAELSRNIGTTSVRVLVTQIGLVFGFLVASVTESAWGMIGTLLVVRALADASIDWLTGLVKQRDLPPGLLRFLARRSRQSAASLEAEFDALKANGGEVEAMLERPIGEVRERG